MSLSGVPSVLKQTCVEYEKYCFYARKQKNYLINYIIWGPSIYFHSIEEAHEEKSLDVKSGIDSI